MPACLAGALGRLPRSRKDARRYLTDFLAQVAKVRVPTGEGETKQKALEAVSKLAPSELPMIPEMPNAPEGWRRVLAYHRELSRLSGGNKYFLSYRDAAKVYSGLTPPKAHNITLALVTVGVIEIVSKGKAGLNSRKAAEFRYLLPEPESAEEDDDEIPVEALARARVEVSRAGVAASTIRG